jgi:hypothetical protein
MIYESPFQTPIFGSGPERFFRRVSAFLMRSYSRLSSACLSARYFAWLSNLQPSSHSSMRRPSKSFVRLYLSGDMNSFNASSVFSIDMPQACAMPGTVNTTFPVASAAASNVIHTAFVAKSVVVHTLLPRREEWSLVNPPLMASPSLPCVADTRAVSGGYIRADQYPKYPNRLNQKAASQDPRYVQCVALHLGGEEHKHPASIKPQEPLKFYRTGLGRDRQSLDHWHRQRRSYLTLQQALSRQEEQSCPLAKGMNLLVLPMGWCTYWRTILPKRGHVNNVGKTVHIQSMSAVVHPSRSRSINRIPTTKRKCLWKSGYAHSAEVTA